MLVPYLVQSFLGLYLLQDMEKFQCHNLLSFQSLIIPGCISLIFFFPVYLFYFSLVGNCSSISVKIVYLPAQYYL